MFPFEQEEEELYQEETETEEDIPREYGIDFETGQLTGKVVEGLDAIRVWAWMALKTARYRYEMYSWDYGCEIESLIGRGNSKEYLESETRRMVEECLSMNPHILGISEFDCKILDEKLILRFTMETDMGEVELNV